MNECWIFLLIVLVIVRIYVCVDVTERTEVIDRCEASSLAYLSTYKECVYR